MAVELREAIGGLVFDSTGLYHTSKTMHVKSNKIKAENEIQREMNNLLSEQWVKWRTCNPLLWRWRLHWFLGKPGELWSRRQQWHWRISHDLMMTSAAAKTSFHICQTRPWGQSLILLKGRIYQSQLATRTMKTIAITNHIWTTMSDLPLPPLCLGLGSTIRQNSTAIIAYRPWRRA